MKTISIQPESPPLRVDLGGAVRVGQTRIGVEFVVEGFLHGDSPETIVANYATLTLADVYGVIAYYLRHRDEVDAYIAEGNAAAESMRQEFLSRQGNELRARLLARQAAKAGG